MGVNFKFRRGNGADENLFVQILTERKMPEDRAVPARRQIFGGRRAAVFEGEQGAERLFGARAGNEKAPDSAAAVGGERND